MRNAVIFGVIGFLVVIGLIIFGLYQLGGADQSALERLRDIAIIFIILLGIIATALLAAIAAAVVYLIFQIKDRIIPLLEELTGTAKRIRGTANFVSEEAVKPIVTVAGTYARMREMTKVVTGRSKKIPRV